MRVRDHCSTHALRELAFARRVLDDRDDHIVVEAVTRDTFDHLEVRAGKVGRGGVEERRKHGAHAVAVHDRAGVAKFIRLHTCSLLLLVRAQWHLHIIPPVR